MEDREYSPQRATRVAAVSSMGTLLVLVGLFAGGGDASGAPAAVTAEVDTATAPITTAPTTALATAPTTTPPTTTPTTPLPTTATVAACTDTYTVLPGDYWLLLADEAGVTVDELYAVNNAGPTVGLFPGQTLCLPAGATVVTTIPTSVPATAPAAVPTTTPTRSAAPAVPVTAAQVTRVSG